VDQKVLKLDAAFNAELRRIINEREAHCPRCKYDLLGIPGPRCPECGKNVREVLRVADVTPWRSPHVRRRMIAAWLFGRLAIVATVVAAGLVAGLVWNQFHS
jgi:predicted amidophosphoribosyltransferase